MNPLKPLTAVEAPLPVLERELKLSEDQVDKIRGIHDEFRRSGRDIMPPPPDAGGPPPDREQMKSMMEKMRSREKEASRRVESVLTGDQRQSLARLLKEISDYRAVGFPPPAVERLKLTKEQKQHIAAIADDARNSAHQNSDGPPSGTREEMDRVLRKAHRQAMDLLTDSQRDVMMKLDRERPRRPAPGGEDDRGPGGPGGPDGRPGDRPAGGPDDERGYTPPPPAPDENDHGGEAAG